PSLLTLLFLRVLRPPTSPLFPYTTLFRSRTDPRRDRAGRPARRNQIGTFRSGNALCQRLILTRARMPFTQNGSSLKISLTSSSLDRKSTRLNSSHVKISYAVFCLKKKNKP